MKKLSSDIKRIAVLSNLNASGHIHQRKEMDAAAPKLGIVLQQLPMQSATELDQISERLSRVALKQLLQWKTLWSKSNRARITEFALTNRLPVMGEFKPMAEAGGLMSYGPNQVAMWERSAFYVDKILKGADPANLPVEQPAKFELTVNLKTARALGVEFPQTLLSLADVVIE